MKGFSRISMLLMILATATVACGDDETGNPDSVRVIEDPRMEDNNETPQPEEEGYIFQAVSATSTVVEIRETLELKVELLTETSLNPVADETISWTILQAPDGSAELSQSQTHTGAAGRSKVDLSVGDLSGQVLVRASVEGVAPVDFVVNVSDLAPGNIEVSIFPPAGTMVDLAPYRVRAYPTSVVNCQTFPRRADLSGYINGVETNGTLVTLTDVPAERSYTVTVQGMGTSQAAIAWGCVDNVDVLTRETTDISVPMNLVPLNPTGTYNVKGFWNLADAIRASGDAGSLVVGLIDFLANPGQFVYDFIIDALADQLDPDIVLILELAGVPTLVEDTINGWLFQNEDLARFNAIAQGLSSMLYTLEVESELVIDKTEADLTFTGFEHWQKIILNLSWRCDATSPPDCGRYEIPVDGDGNLPGLGYVSYEWEGAVVNYDQLDIASHETLFEYGKLLVLIIDQVIAPELTDGNANSLSDALAYWIDCPGLAADIVGSTSGFGYTTALAACNAGASAAANAVTQPLMDQDVTFTLELEGEATLNDSASNGFVDQILDGHNHGTLVDSGAPVLVDWTAELLHP